ncbi:hypothetical protein EYZ11_010757 [Aspergillus tanneri]|nr:hypothetical protein EYZ11_010757 [Aspergillus tanneri]
MQQLVKYTSPGFEVFWKCETNRLDIHSAYMALFELFSVGKASPKDMDPSGKSWLERILYPTFGNADMRIAFMKMLVQWGAPMNTKTS